MRNLDLNVLRHHVYTVEDVQCSPAPSVLIVVVDVHIAIISTNI